MGEIPRYIGNPSWRRIKPKSFLKGQYVVATKYNDGDPGDQFCIGFYDSSIDHFGQTRHFVVDNNGNQFRNNGFRRVERVSIRRGEWMVKNLALIERMKDKFSVWHWHRAPWRELSRHSVASRTIITPITLIPCLGKGRRVVVNATSTRAAARRLSSALYFMPNGARQGDKAE